MAPYTSSHALLCAVLPSILLVGALPTDNGTTTVSHDFFRGDDGVSDMADLNAVPSAIRPMTRLLERHLGDDELFERADRESSNLHSDIQAGSLHKRTLTINQADFKGRQLAKLLDTDNPFPNTHQWTDMDALNNWEWRKNHEKCGLEHEDDIIDPVSASLGPTVRAGVREERWENPPSRAEYKTFMGPGVIFSWDESAPQGKYPPQLSKWSDVVPMIYKDAFPLSPLRLVVEMIVNDPDTAGVIDALRSDKQLPSPPVPYSNREVFRIGTPQFYALLGTPTGHKVAEGAGGNPIIFGQNLCIPEIHFWSQNRLASTLAFRLMDAPCGAAEAEKNYLPRGIAVGAGRPSKPKSDTNAAQGGIAKPEGSANFGRPGSSIAGRQGRQKRSASSHWLARRGKGDFPATDADDEEDPDVSDAEWQDTAAKGKRSATLKSSDSGLSEKTDQAGDLIMTDAPDNAFIPSAEDSVSKADASSDARSSGFSDDDMSMTEAPTVSHNDHASAEQSLDASDDNKNNAAQTIYDNSRAKGQEVIQLLDLEPTAAMPRQSKWTQFKDLARYGWIIDDPDPEEVDQDFTWDGMQVLDSELNLGGKTHLAGHVCVHDKAVKVEGVDYPATQAVYKNYFSLDAGAIVVVQANSPQRAGPDNAPPVTGPFPPLSHWSDLTYLILQELTKAQSSKLRDLKTITFAMIDNKPFKEVLEWIMCGTGTDYDEIFWDDRLSFLYGSEEYVTLMGTPIGVAAAHFLGQHKRELGWLGIAKIEIFRDDDPEESDSGPVPHMVMYLEDGPVLQSSKGQILDKELVEEPESIGTSTGRITRSSGRRDVHDIQNAPSSEHLLVRQEEDKFDALDAAKLSEPGVVGAKSEAGSSKGEVKQLGQLPPRPVKPNLTTENAVGSLTQPAKSDYGRQGPQKRADNLDRALLSRCLHYGAALASQLNSRDHSNSQPSQFRAGQLQDATARSGWCLDAATSMTFTAAPLAPALQQMGIANGGPLQIREWSFDTDPNDENARQAINSGLYHEGLIVAVDSESPSHTVGYDAALPELQYWSDIAFLQYTQHFPRAPLENIIRQGIIESDTIAVIEMIRHSRRLGDERSDHNYPQTPNAIILDWGTNHYNAMLGTAGGKGVAHMLLQHRQDLGHRCVEAIRIWYGPDKDLPTVWYKIKEAPCRGPSGRSKRTLGEALQSDNNIASRSEDEKALLDEYSKKGAGWALGLNGGDPDIWCESIWTAGQLQEATSAWGWTCTADEVSSASRLASAGPVMDVMYQRSPDQIMVRKVTWTHNRQVTTSEGPLPPTMAEYTNYYLPGAIIGERNESPKQSGSSHGVNVNSDENLPALRAWSDVVFLQYAQLFPGLPLQAVIRQEVYNQATKDVVDAFRHVIYKLHDDPVLTDYPQFPGFEFKYGTKEFRALLAVPVGEGVVHLLSQHRDALGQLCVWGIRVFWNINMQNPTIWYRIKQAPCKPRDGPAGLARRSIDEPLPDGWNRRKRADTNHSVASTKPEDEAKFM